MTTPVILDANALLAPFQFGIHLERELDRLLGSYEIVVPASVIRELEKLDNPHTKAALSLAGRYTIGENKGVGDAVIVALAIKLNAYVVTNDRPLGKFLRKKGLGVISMRQKKYLVLEED